MLGAHGQPARDESGQDQDAPDRQEPGLGGRELAPRLPAGLVEERRRLARVKGAAAVGGGVGCEVHGVSLDWTLCHKVDAALWRKVKGFAGRTLRGKVQSEDGGTEFAGLATAGRRRSP